MLQGLRRGIRQARDREGRGGGDAASSSRNRAGCRCSTAGSRPAESPSPRRSTASASAAPSSWRSPAIIRVLSDADSTRVGLPEIKVGLFPGAGGTQRVSRLMQTGDALQMLFKGEQIRALMARNMGLVHEVAPRDGIVEAAKDWIKNGGSAGGALGPRRTSSCPRTRSIRPPACRSGPPPTPSTAARRRTTIRPPTRSSRRSIRACSSRWIWRCAVEWRWFAKILRSKEAAAMIRTLFLSMQELNKGARRPKDVPPTRLEEGRRRRRRASWAPSIAYVTRQCRASTVVLVDRDMEAAEKGKAYSHKLMTDQIMKGRAKTADRDALLARITPLGRLRRPEGLRSRHRGGVRGSEGQGRGDREGRGRDPARLHLRLEHLDAADLRPREILAAARRSSSASTSSRRSRR